MAQLGDAVVQFPLSGSSSGSVQIPLAAFMRTVQQASSASNYVAFHPSGVMTGSLQLAPRNNNRTGWSIYNSGTLLMAIDHGAYFNPHVPPPVGVSSWDRLVAAGSAYDELQIAYTGPIHVAWVGSGTLSGSSAVLTEYSF